MDKAGILKHWHERASTHGINLLATTKTSTIKALEVDALARRIRALTADGPSEGLEAGCGNGLNCVELAKQFPTATFDGFDYVPQMVDSAQTNATNAGLGDRVRFFHGDVLDIAGQAGLRKEYDVVFTDRCLVNVNTVSQQKQAITQLATKLRPGGHLLMIENSIQTFGDQNRCREIVGLPPRTPAQFNLFFDETEIRPHLGAIGLKLIDVEDFATLHDLVLYVLIPAIGCGKVDYDHPLMEVATLLNMEMAARQQSPFGAFGQNRLFVCRKED